MSQQFFKKGRNTSILLPYTPGSNPACTRSDKSPGCKSDDQTSVGNTWHRLHFGYICTWAVSYVRIRAKNKMPYMRPATVRSLRGPKENARTALTSSRVFRDYGIGKDSYDRGHGQVIETNRLDTAKDFKPTEFHGVEGWGFRTKRKSVNVSKILA